MLAPSLDHTMIGHLSPMSSSQRLLLMLTYIVRKAWRSHFISCLYPPGPQQGDSRILWLRSRQVVDSTSKLRVIFHISLCRSHWHTSKWPLSSKKGANYYWQVHMTYRVINNFRGFTLHLPKLPLIEGAGFLGQFKIPHTYLWSPSLLSKPDDWDDFTGMNIIL